MGQVIDLEEAAAALPRRGTGFAYCPEPDAATLRAWRRSCNEAVYTAAVLFLTFVGAAGAAWMIGSAVWHAWTGARR